MTQFSRLRRLVATGAVLSLGTFASVVYASHAWGNYHWARTANPLSLKLGDNVSDIWDTHLALASTNWSQSLVLDTNIVTGQANPKNCRATNGRVEVCNSRYGNNGWLGIASIWANGNHITQGTVKLNDTYFNTTKYNTPAWRNLVMCQEVGHTFGLSHQDETFDNPPLGTCMDYTNDPTPNQQPNLHDYEELETIYTHLDSSTTALSPLPSASASDIDTTDPKEWGKAIRKSSNGRNSLYERNLGQGRKLFTFVYWADQEE